MEFDRGIRTDLLDPVAEMRPSWRRPSTATTTAELALAGRAEFTYSFGGDPSDADWEDVGELHNEEEIASMKEFGRYVGYRVGMPTDGTGRSSSKATDTLREGACAWVSKGRTLVEARYRTK